MDVKDNVKGKIEELASSNTAKWIGYLLIFVAVCVAGWAMFSSVSDNRRATDDLREQINTTRAELDRTRSTLESVQRGLERSQQLLDGIEGANKQAQESADRISDLNDSIKKSVDDATVANARSAGLIDSSKQGVGEIQSVLEAVRKTATVNGE